MARKMRYNILKRLLRVCPENAKKKKKKEIQQ